MAVSITTMQAYAEVDEFIGLLENEQINKIPLKLREFFKEEKDKEYKKGIDRNIAIKDQNLKNETLAIIALLNLNYWCEDENEKAELRKIYAENEKVYQDIMQVDFIPNEIFNKKSEIKEVENTQILVYKESAIKKIINWIKKALTK